LEEVPEKRRPKEMEARDDLPDELFTEDYLLGACES